MSKTKAAIFGFLVAPVVAALIGAMLTLPTTEILNLDPISVLALTGVFYFFAAAATITFAVPAFLLLCRFGLVTWWTTLLSGIVIGAAAAAILRAPDQVGIRDIWVLGSMGAASSLSFWLVWRLGR